MTEQIPNIENIESESAVGSINNYAQELSDFYERQSRRYGESLDTGGDC